MEERALRAIAGLLEERSLEGYLVGGYVRDRLLGRPSVDIDLVVERQAVELAKEAADRLGGSFFVLDEETEVARVILKEEPGPILFIDFALMRAGSILGDLALRDFTLDAMAMKIGSPLLIDPHGGQRDLEARWLRAVSERIFQDDPLRMLRAVRLAAELNLRIDPKVEKLIREGSALLSEVSEERIRDELAKILLLPGTSCHLSRLDDLGLLREILPEITALRGVGESGEGLRALYLHSLAVVDGLERILAGEAVPLAPLDQKLSVHVEEELGGGRPRLVSLKLAALFQKVGGSAFPAMRRLRFSRREIALVQAILKGYLRPKELSAREDASDLGAYRFFRHRGKAGIDILLLSLAEYLVMEQTGAQIEGFPELVGSFLRKYYEERERVISPPKLISGHDLQAKFGLAPGTRLGELLEQVREARVRGWVATREEALEFVGRILAER